MFIFQKKFYLRRLSICSFPKLTKICLIEPFLRSIVRENTDLNFLSFSGTEICDEDEASEAETGASEASSGGWRLESLRSARPRTLGDAFSFSLKQC